MLHAPSSHSPILTMYRPPLVQGADSIATGLNLPSGSWLTQGLSEFVSSGTQAHAAVSNQQGASQGAQQAGYSLPPGSAGAPSTVGEGGEASFLSSTVPSYLATGSSTVPSYLATGTPLHDGGPTSLPPQVGCNCARLANSDLAFSSHQHTKSSSAVYAKLANSNFSIQQLEATKCHAKFL